MRAIRSGGVVAITLVLVLVGAACSSSGKSSSASTSTTRAPAAAAIVWPAPPDPLVRARAAGLVPETAERLTYHVHAHLDVFVNGQRVTVPAGLGINIHDPGVHTFETLGAPAYGGINPPCDQPCISPLHTHDISGVIHTESATVQGQHARSVLHRVGCAPRRQVRAELLPPRHEESPCSSTGRRSPATRERSISPT